MGYACPVCDVPQQDGEHLANHLAFTAMTHGGDHESWLDEHVPEWSSSGPAELAPRVTERAEEAPYETVFEDTVHDHAGGAHDRGSPFDEDPTAGRNRVDADDARQRGAGALDAEAQAVLDEAREMTREMLGDEGGEDGESDGEADGDASE